MKLLLIALNRETHPYPVQPIGVAYIAEVSRRAGHEVLLLDMNLRDNPLKDLQQTVADFVPEVIGFGLRNIDNCVFPNLEFYVPWAQEVISLCRNISSAKLVIGGSGFTVMPKEILEYLELEVGILGEGEKSFSALLKVWSENIDAPLGSIEGLAILNRGVFHKTKSTSVSLEQQFFLPARDMLDIPSYLRGGSLTAVQTKRGCSLKCSYCTYPLIEGIKVRIRHYTEVVDELEHLQQTYGVDEIFFTDNVFNNPVIHAIEICKEIVKRGLKISWTGFFHPAFMVEELADWAARSGCVGIEFGTEGGTTTSLKALRKGFTVETLIRSHKIAQSAGLKVCHYLIVGSPSETLATVREGLDLIASLQPTAVLVSTGIRIYPNTAIADIAKSEGYDIKNLLIPQFYFPPSMCEDPVGMVAAISKEYPQFRFEGFHARPSLKLLEALRRRGHRGPTWRLQGLLQNLRNGS